MSESLQIGLIYPELLGTYGDNGNALVLARRAELHGFKAEVVEVAVGESIPEGLDVYVLGGGEDTPKEVAFKYLNDSVGFRNACDSGKPVLSVCASTQILGRWFVNSQGVKVDGLGVLDISTMVNEIPGVRHVGELVSVPVVSGLSELLTGFENHACVTALGEDALPLGRVLVGVGNGEDCAVSSALDAHVSMQVWEKYASVLDSVAGRFDGVSAGNIVGTYMHGPCLARNPELADWFLSKAVGYPLENKSFGSVCLLREERLKAVGIDL